jgi:DNA modification methylase
VRHSDTVLSPSSAEACSNQHYAQQPDVPAAVLVPGPSVAPVRQERPVTVDVRHGDAFDLLDALPKSSVDCLITSPPYWGHRDYGLPHNWEFFNDIPTVRKIGPKSRGYAWYRRRGGLLGLEPYPEWFVQHLAEILDKARAPLKASGSMWINVGDTYFARWASIREQGRQGLGTDERERRKTPLGGPRQEKSLLLIPARFAIAMQDRGWILRNDVVWYKPNAVPRPEGDRLKNAHEHFFHFVKKPSSGRAKYFYDISRAEPKAIDVVTVNVAPGEEGHSATFPRDLIEPRILSSCPPEGTVLDPFSGTGRALEVAVKNGMRAIGFDAQADFVALQTEKLNGDKEKHKRGQPRQ